MGKKERIRKLEAEMRVLKDLLGWRVDDSHQNYTTVHIVFCDMSNSVTVGPDDIPHIQD